MDSVNIYIISLSYVTVCVCVVVSICRLLISYYGVVLNLAPSNSLKPVLDFVYHVIFQACVPKPIYAM